MRFLNAGFHHSCPLPCLPTLQNLLISAKDFNSLNMSPQGMAVGEAFSAGIGLALGLVTGQYMFQTIGPPARAEVEQVIICRKCSTTNPVENKFCNNCGQRLYPSPKITCENCDSEMPATMKFCGNCGATLKK
jgi:membrane protease subunit (stomatin/prohibitin family)